MAEMRAAVESSQVRSPPTPAATPGLPGKSKSVSTFGIGKVFNTARPTSTIIVPTSSAVVSLPLNIALVAALLVAIKTSGGTTQEGIFRLSGSSSSVKLIYEMMVASSSPDLSGCDPNDLASALKMYLRELSSPLIPFVCYANLISSVQGPGKIDQESLKQALALVPPENRSVLRILIAFTQTIVANQATTKMNAKNLAIVFGPTLLRSEDPMAGLREAAQQTDIIQELIEKYPIYFDPSTFDQLAQALSLIEQTSLSSSSSSSSSPSHPSSAASSSHAPPTLTRTDSKSSTVKKGGLFGRR